MSTDSKNLFVFLGDKFSELVHTIISFGCRQLGNFTLLIRLPGTVSNGLSARQLEIFAKMPPKGSFKLLKNIRCLLRNAKRLQKLIFFSTEWILRACAYYNITRLSTLKFYASDQTAGHGLKWTKCPAVKNFNQNATERFLQASKSIRCLLTNVKRF